MNDSRFNHIASDPRFKRVSKKRHKVTVDKRFKTMFTDDRFKTNYHVDKRGKEVDISSQEDLKRFYSLEDGQDSDEASDDEDDDDDDDNGRDCNDGADETVASHEDQYESDGSSSTDLDYDAILSHENNDIEYDWGDMTGEVERSSDISNRLAVCNMNWDRINAQDLYVLFNSFKPQDGLVRSVKIYLSDYGKERLEQEEISGPTELVETSSKESHPQIEGDSSNPDLVEGQDFARAKLRQYQLNRLKYYYAIIECSDEATAEHIYDQCDGMEYENSASTVDLRFVPTDTVFDREPVTVATELSIKADFTPSTFFTSALQQTSVSLTWDETDPSRLRKTMASFSKEELENMDFGAYLASSSDEEDIEPFKQDQKTYRKLLGIADRDDEGSTASDNEDLEISWNMGLEEEGEQTFEDEETEEIKAKSLRRKGESNKIDQTSDNENNAGFDDPFFSEVPSGKKKRRMKNKLTSEEKEQKEREKNELELLMMSDDETAANGKKHFSLKDITANEGKERGKRKRKNRKFRDENETAGDTGEDGFKVDTSDPRFSALYESHLYAIDPTNSQYKQTKGMQDILSEKQKRSKNKKANNAAATVGKGESHATAVDHGLSSLVSSVKAKATNHMERKKKKRALL